MLWESAVVSHTSGYLTICCLWHWPEGLISSLLSLWHLQNLDSQEMKLTAFTLINPVRLSTCSSDSKCSFFIFSDASLLNVVNTNELFPWRIMVFIKFLSIQMSMILLFWHRILSNNLYYEWRQNKLLSWFPSALYTYKIQINFFFIFT